MPVTADQIVVDAGSTLTQTNNLTLANGAGDDLTVSGTWNWSGNYLYGPGFARIAPGGLLNLTTSSYKYFTTDITNDGTIDFQEGIFRFEDFKTVINNGTFLLGANQSFQHGLVGAGIFTNNGSVTKATAGNADLDVTTINNNGTFNCNAGTISNNNDVFNNAGTIAFNSGTFANGGVFNYNTGSVLSGTGTLTNNSVLNMNISAMLPSVLLLVNNSTVNLALATTLTITGNGTWNSGTISGPGSFAVGATGTLALATGSTKFFTADITNAGTIDWQDGIFRFEDFKTVTNNGSFLMAGNLSFQHGIVGAGTFTNNSIVTITSPGNTDFDVTTFNNNGTLNCNGGITSNNNDVFNNAGAIVFFSGTFNNAGAFN